MENNNPKYYFKYFSFQFRLKFIVLDIRAFYGKLNGAKTCYKTRIMRKNIHTK